MYRILTTYSENLHYMPRSTRFSLLTDLLVALTIAVAAIALYHTYINTDVPQKTEMVQNEYVPTLQFGFDINTHLFDRIKLKPNQFLGDILYYEGVDFKKIIDLEKNSKDVYNVRKLKSGKELTFVRHDSCVAPSCFIYEPDPYRYVLFNLGDSTDVKVVHRPITKCIEVASGVVESSLWNAMIENHLSPSMIDKMEDALASSVDFYHAKSGDKFKLIYEMNYIDSKPVGVGKLLCGYYQNKYGEHYAVYYESENYSGYFDLEGGATKKAFLRAPVKFSRISSRYSHSRLHPIKKRRIPHFGTDYAAPYGTPIRTVADGVVSMASYTRGNGKYVKIRHNKTYQTQYLHMQKFAKGMKKGRKVSQGETIGYVGSTGLATGSHVCFRFWKNGKQVDHLRENFPPAKPIEESELPDYFQKRDEIKSFIDLIPFFDNSNDDLAVNDDRT